VGATAEVETMTVTIRIETNEASPDFIKQLAGYGLATAEISFA
jgi:hypothetical protein